MSQKLNLSISIPPQGFVRFGVRLLMMFLVRTIPKPENDPESFRLLVRDDPLSEMIRADNHRRETSF